jgi:lysozyme
VVNKKLAKSNVDLNKFVVDVSAWQRPQDIDYNTLSQQIIGAIVRVQTGKASKDNTAALKSGQDTQYKTHIEEFQKRGVPVAVYAYVNGKTNAEMKQQAKDFYERSHQYHPTYYWLDVEEDNMKDMNGGIETFRSELASLGVKNIGIYAQDWFLTDNKIDVSKFTSIWMADYGRDTGYWDSSPVTDLDYDMQQFTDKGSLPGFAGSLDLNMIRTQDEYHKLFKNPQ